MMSLKCDCGIYYAFGCKIHQAHSFQCSFAIGYPLDITFFPCSLSSRLEWCLWLSVLCITFGTLEGIDYHV